MYAQLAIKRLEEIKPLIDAKENATGSVQKSSLLQEETAQSLLDNVAHVETFISKNLPYSFSDTKRRPVQIHEEMLFVFESIANNNTKHNKETCGVLAGVFKNRLLVVTSLIIPKQQGMSDSCEMLNEEELFALQVRNYLHTFDYSKRRILHVVYRIKRI